MNNKIKTEIAIGIILVVAIISGGLVWFGNKKNERIATPTNQQPITNQKKDKVISPNADNLIALFPEKVYESKLGVSFIYEPDQNYAGYYINNEGQKKSQEENIFYEEGNRISLASTSFDKSGNNSNDCPKYTDCFEKDGKLYTDDQSWFSIYVFQKDTNETLEKEVSDVLKKEGKNLNNCSVKINQFSDDIQGQQTARVDFKKVPTELKGAGMDEFGQYCGALQGSCSKFSSCDGSYFLYKESNSKTKFLFLKIGGQDIPAGIKVDSIKIF